MSDWCGSEKATVCRQVRGLAQPLEFEADAPFKPLIHELWRLGIELEDCCQRGRLGLAMISFPRIRDAENFLFCAENEDYRAELEALDEEVNGWPKVGLELVVRFPVEHIGAIIDQLARYERLPDGEIAWVVPERDACEV
jgi:hypothetical protein